MVREAGGVRVDVGGGEMDVGWCGSYGMVWELWESTAPERSSIPQTHKKIPEAESAFGIFSSYMVRRLLHFYL